MTEQIDVIVESLKKLGIDLKEIAKRLNEASSEPLEEKRNSTDYRISQYRTTVTRGVKKSTLKPIEGFTEDKSYKIFNESMKTVTVEDDAGNVKEVPFIYFADAYPEEMKEEHDPEWQEQPILELTKEERQQLYDKHVGDKLIKDITLSEQFKQIEYIVDFLILSGVDSRGFIKHLRRLTNRLYKSSKKRMRQLESI